MLMDGKRIHTTSLTPSKEESSVIYTYVTEHLGWCMAPNALEKLL